MSIDEFLSSISTEERGAGRSLRSTRQRAATGRVPAEQPCGTSRWTSRSVYRTRPGSSAALPGKPERASDPESARAQAARANVAPLVATRASRVPRDDRQARFLRDRHREAARPPTSSVSGCGRRSLAGGRRCDRRTAARAHGLRAADWRTCHRGARARATRASPGYSNPQDPANGVGSDAPATEHHVSLRPLRPRLLRDRFHAAPAGTDGAQRHPIVRDRTRAHPDVAQRAQLTPLSVFDLSVGDICCLPTKRPR